MATEAIEARAVNTDLDARPGVVDRILQYVDDLPGPAAAWWAGVGVVLALIGHVVVWSTSDRPFGQILHDVVVPALIFGWFMWLNHTLNKVGAAAFDDFRPALDAPELEAGYRRRLLSVDDRMAVIAVVVAALVVSIFYYLGVRPARGPLPPEIEIVSAPLWGLTAAALGLAILHTITQLWLVSRLSGLARNVDIFKPGAINAFSRLTAVSALGLIAFVVVFVLFSPEQPLPYIIQESVVLAIAVLSFVLPLNVMHNRLVAEKKRLLGESQDRLKAVLSKIHDAVDDGDLAQSEQLHHSLSAVLAEQDVLEKLRTWPWSTATIRGFASALILPIALIVFTQVVDRIL
jgi:hypothetical protein